jgi:bifunctional oligoribonuclease and PAP phosphatase NrnA
MGDSQRDIIEDLVASIRSNQRFLVATHVRPDGDAIGSVLSMVHILQLLGKAADPYCRDPVPTAYTFLPAAGSIGHTVPGPGPSLYDVAILVDCGEFLRVGPPLAESIRKVPFLVSIDHHVSHTSFGDLFWNTTSASSTCEMLYDLCLRLPLAIDSDLATTLYTGLLADTGSFRFSNTNQRVLEIAANLVAAGADPAFIAEQVYDSASVEGLRLLARVLATLSFHANGRLATAQMSRKMFSETAANPADAEGFINFLRSVKPVEMAMLFREGTEGNVHVSMRSKGDVDVASFAQRQGGGGHRHAAAFEVSGRLGAIRSRFTDEAQLVLEQMTWKR